MITHHIENEIVTVSCFPHIVQGEIAKLKTYLGSFLNDPQVNALLFDFSEVTHLDSSGIGTFVLLRKQFDARLKGKTDAIDGPTELAFFSVNDSVMKIFRMMLLDRTFTFFPDEAAARTALSQK